MEEFKDKSKKKILELVDETGEEFKFFVKYKITVKDVAGNIETYFCDGRKFIQKVEGGYNALTDEEIKELLSKETDNSYEFNKEEIS